MGLTKTDQLTSAKPSAIYSLDFQPLTLSINNTSKFPIYVYVGTVAIPSSRAFSDVIAPFSSYVRDPNGARDFAIFIDTSSDPTNVFTFPVVVTFSTGAASSQVPSSIGSITVSANAYIAKLQSVEGANLIDLWPLQDTVLAIAIDKMATARNGAYVNAPTLQAVIGPDNTTKQPSFNGTNQYVDVFSAGSSSAFNPNQGSLLVWVQVLVSKWGDANTYYFANIRVDANNDIRVFKQAGGTLAFQYVGAGVFSTCSNTPAHTNNWRAIVATWSTTPAPRVRLYLDGVSLGDIPITNNLVGVPVAETIGSNLTPANFLPGNIGPVALWTKELTAAEVLIVSTAP